MTRRGWLSVLVGTGLYAVTDYVSGGTFAHQFAITPFIVIFLGPFLYAPGNIRDRVIEFKDYLDIDHSDPFVPVILRACCFGILLALVLWPWLRYLKSRSRKTLIIAMAVLLVYVCLSYGLYVFLGWALDGWTD